MTANKLIGWVCGKPASGCVVSFHPDPETEARIQRLFDFYGSRARRVGLTVMIEAANGPQ